MKDNGPSLCILQLSHCIFMTARLAQDYAIEQGTLVRPDDDRVTMLLSNHLRLGSGQSANIIDGRFVGTRRLIHIRADTVEIEMQTPQKLLAKG